VDRSGNGSGTVSDRDRVGARARYATAAGFDAEDGKGSGRINKDVFNIDDSFQNMRGAAPTHWSVAWSDLMMTMFILFMTLYIYQMANRNMGEKSQKAADGEQQNAPFYVPGSDFPSDNSGGTSNVKQAQDSSILVDGALPKDMERERLAAVKQSRDVGLEAEVSSTWKGSEKGRQPGDELTPSTNRKEPKEVPMPEEQPQVLTKLFDLSQYTLAQEKLQHFAKVDVVKDKAVRIILTGDLLFASGQAKLTGAAEEALSRLSPVLRRLPYMINVVGHTDSMPMYSAQFPSNWELSVARASSVARFLMEEMELPGRQFVVSGYAYYRPVMPNNSAANRARNRRVEIIISKELPDAVSANENNLK